ncbi:DUF4765 family protein [Streptomyces sp. NPDC091377]|uniref:DUF4765 family protein n=1 Tax=unclassified Streptomyces TaxID=2593676 RepID=UPI003818B53A
MSTPAAPTRKASTPARHKTGRTRLPEDHDNYDSEADDFDETFVAGENPLLPRPTEQSSVARLVDRKADELVTLWRAMKLTDADELARTGGAAPRTADGGVTEPSAAEVKEQIGRGKGLTIDGVQRRLMEFTTAPSIAEGFSAGGGAVVVAQVAAKYLVKGSESEGGWIPHWGAPVNVLHIVDRKILDRGQRQFNAS